MLSRRTLMMATAGSIGLQSGSWLQLSASTRHPVRKRCVLVWLDGGPSHIDTLDPKPHSPEGHGGPFRPISTNVAGIQVSETLPEIAKLMDRCAVIRGMSTPANTHGVGRMHLHTGYFSAVTLDFPSVGSVVAYLQSDGRTAMPRYVHLGGGRSHGCSSGFLGAQYSPLIIGNQIPFLKSPVHPHEFDRRIGLLRELESLPGASHEGMFVSHRETREMTLEFMQSDFSETLRLDSEPIEIRERYGKTPAGEACLRARRLLEQDVAFVEVNSSHWDMHGKIYSPGGGIQVKAAEVDRAVSALVLDLRDRGLLDETLIVWMGEFGRTPKLNRSPGRDHYAKAWSTMLLGGGIPGGQVIGETDQSGATVVNHPVSAADFLATVYRILGFDHATELTGRGNRPLPLVDRQTNPNPIATLI